MKFKVLIAAVLTGVLCASAFSQQDPSSEEKRAQEAWEKKADARRPAERGCFTIEYPSIEWQRVACVEAPVKVYGHPAINVPAVDDTLPGNIPPPVGGGSNNDYMVMQTGGWIGSTIGSFPNVIGLESELDSGNNPNSYSIQLNTNQFATPTCGMQAACKGWQQNIYDTTSQTVFMQYLLVGHTGKCPLSWSLAPGGACFKNSPAAFAGPHPITELSAMKMKATAQKNGNDTLTFTTAHGKQYTTSGLDSVLSLGAPNTWLLSEFNVFGDSDFGNAKFNPGTTLTVKLQVNTHGGDPAPWCFHSTTTGETNNLNLGTCSVIDDYIQFIESN